MKTTAVRLRYALLCLDRNEIWLVPAIVQEPQPDVRILSLCYANGPIPQAEPKEFIRILKTFSDA